jgi:hypothetical protein
MNKIGSEQKLAATVVLWQQVELAVAQHLLSTYSAPTLAPYFYRKNRL